MQARLRSRIVAGAAIVTSIASTGCSDTRLEKLSAGITRDSALAIINAGASGDSLARVYRQESYLLENKKGNAHVANVLFYNKNGVKQADDSTLKSDATTPVVVVDGKVTGWGWTYYDSVAKANNSQAPARP